jgi:hypothetical protein
MRVAKEYLSDRGRTVVTVIQEQQPGAGMMGL